MDDAHWMNVFQAWPSSREMTLDQFSRQLQAFGRGFPHVVVRAFQRAAIDGRGAVVRETAKAQPFPAVDTGAFMRSWIVEKHNHGAIIGNDTLQAPIMEGGRRPGMPPVDPLIQWAYRKMRGIEAQNRAARRKASGRRKAVARKAASRKRRSVVSWRGGLSNARRMRAARSFGWAVALKIKREGIEQREPLGNAWPAILRFVEQRLNEAIQKFAQGGSGKL